VFDYFPDLPGGTSPETLLKYSFSWTVYKLGEKSVSVHIQFLDSPPGSFWAIADAVVYIVAYQ